MSGSIYTTILSAPTQNLGIPWHGLECQETFRTISISSIYTEPGALCFCLATHLSYHYPTMGFWYYKRICTAATGGPSSPRSSTPSVPLSSTRPDRYLSRLWRGRLFLLSSESFHSVGGFFLYLLIPLACTLD